MLILRFQKQGKKKDFVFRIIAVDSRVAVNSGKAKEILGWYNPKTKQSELKKERILYWLDQGAQVSDTCFNFLIQNKVIQGKKRPIKISKKKVKKDEPTEAIEQTGQEQLTEDIKEEAKSETEPQAEVSEKEKTDSEIKEETKEETKEKLSPEKTETQEEKKEMVDEKEKSDVENLEK
ncbi:MAG: 30S ribosomal protein S16 [Candidatus Pacebacteria bacterium]|nr:30S ribosomal protein S16 [Candidatus Paceibacterota bacterium]MDD5721993.1 30S ribosomal protein S16 [Candidatus Paceibacterota bacterium]